MTFWMVPWAEVHASGAWQPWRGAIRTHCAYGSPRPDRVRLVQHRAAGGREEADVRGVLLRWKQALAAQPPESAVAQPDDTRRCPTPPNPQALPVYIACCDVFVWVHHDQYWQRAWCLTEQVRPGRVRGAACVLRMQHRHVWGAARACCFACCFLCWPWVPYASKWQSSIHVSLLRPPDP